MHTVEMSQVCQLASLESCGLFSVHLMGGGALRKALAAFFLANDNLKNSPKSGSNHFSLG